MRKVFIEKYRGYDIEFDVDEEKFQCIVTDNDNKESKSLAAVRKFVDEYIKNNQKFSPFWVELCPGKGGWSTEKRLKIIGLRKDNRFMAELPDGTKTQVSGYDMNRYIIEDIVNKQIIDELNQESSDKEYADKEWNKARKAKIETIEAVDLAEFRSNLLKEDENE